MGRDYHIDLGFPEKSCVDLVSQVAFNWRPIDRVAREVRKIAYCPELMVSRDAVGLHYYNEKIKEIIAGIDGLVDDQGHPLVVEVKKVVIAFYKAMEKMGGNPVGKEDIPFLS